MTAHYDMVVVGGGLVGAALAFGMRKLGPALAVFDEGDVALRASRGNFGLIWVQGKGLGLADYGNWTQRSAREWPALAAALHAESGIDVALQQPGGVHVCLSQRALDARMAMFDSLFAQPGFERYDVEALDRASLARRIPRIGPDVAGATWSPLDGHCNPLRLLHALHRALAVHRVNYHPDQRIVAVDAVPGGFRLTTPRGTVHAERVVLAAGLGNAALAPMVGVAAPVRPNKGQVIVLERLAPFLSIPTENVRQTDDGTVLLGNSQEDRGFDDALGLDVLGTIARRALAIFPMLRDLRVIRAWAALRVMTPDTFPIYAQSPTMPGAFVVGCHSGVTLAAVHANVVAPAIVDGGLPPLVERYAPSRFGDVRPAA